VKEKGVAGVAASKFAANVRSEEKHEVVEKLKKRKRES
jgi:hypothetical protein